MNKSTRFIFWELLGVFFLASYSWLDNLIGTSSDIELIIGISLRWLWIILMIFCLAFGLISLRKR